MFSITKSYRDFPAAHRQPNHKGHCRFIHGHDWGWDICFTCDVLDANNFVIDVGKLTEVKAFLTKWFDHTLLLNEDDPLLKDPVATKVLNEFAVVMPVPSCGMEGLAKFVFDGVTKLIDDEVFEDTFERNLRILSVTCWEDSKNRSTYTSNHTPPKLT